MLRDASGPRALATPSALGKRPASINDHRPRRLPWTLGLAVAVVAVTTRLGLRAVSDPSPWLHLKVGRYLLDGGRFGLPDPWAPFATRAFVPTEWLPSIVTEQLYAGTGVAAIAWLRCLSMLLLLTAVLWTARRVANPVPSLLAAFVTVLAAGEGMTERPQAISLVFLAVTVGAWWRTAEDLKPRWWLIPMTWLWASSHGLWVVGLGLGVVIVAALAIDRRLDVRTARRLLAIPVLGLVSAALTPIGPRLLLTPLTIGANGSNFVGEWQPTSIRDPYAVLTVAMLAVVLLSWFRSRAVPPWWQISIALLSVVSTLAITRTIAVGAVLAAPLLAQALQGRRELAASPGTRRTWGVWALLVVCAAVVAAPVAGAVAATPARVPDRLRPQLSLIPAGTVVLADGDLSGWLFWADPQIKPVLDPRIEIYSPAHVRGFVGAMAAAPGWRRFVDRTGARYALVTSGSAIATALTERAEWTLVGKDAGFTLLKAP